jgi:hypothetical protein
MVLVFLNNTAIYHKKLCAFIAPFQLPICEANVSTTPNAIQDRVCDRSSVFLFKNAQSFQVLHLNTLRIPRFKSELARPGELAALCRDGRST